MAERVMRGLIGTFPKPRMQALVPKPLHDPDLELSSCFQMGPSICNSSSLDEKKQTWITKPLECALAGLLGSGL